jgi:hypothetical protein
MKFRKAFLILFLAYTYNGFASNFDEHGLSCFLRTSKIIENRVYLEPGTVYISPNQIFLNLNGQLLPIETLSTDEGGIFVTVEGVLNATRKNNEAWKCRRCGRINSIEDKWCETCGRDPYGNLCP